MLFRLWTLDSSAFYATLTLQIFKTGNGNSPISSLPPSLACLPGIVSHLEDLKNGTSVGTDLTDTWATSDSAYASVDSNKRFPAPTTTYATSISARNELRNSLSRFYLSMEESMGDLSPNAGFQRPFPEINTMGSSIRKPRPLRPTTVRMPTNSSSNQQIPRHQSSCTDVLMTSPKRVSSFEEEEDERVTLKELLRASAFTRGLEASCGGIGASAKVTSCENEVDYDDPCTDDAYDSVSDCSRDLCFAKSTASQAYVTCHTCAITLPLLHCLMPHKIWLYKL